MDSPITLVTFITFAGLFLPDDAAEVHEEINTEKTLPIIDGRMLQLQYIRECEGSKIDLLFKSALILLEDGCPPDPKQYLCLNDCDDETACKRCWSEYLFRIRNM